MNLFTSKSYMSFFLVLVVTLTPLLAQSVTISRNRIRSPKQVVYLTAKSYGHSKDKKIFIRNRTRRAYRVNVHTHSGLNFVTFKDRTGKESKGLTINLRPRLRGYISLHVDLKKAKAQLYNDKVVFDLLTKKGRRISRTYIPLVAFVYKDFNAPDGAGKTKDNDHGTNKKRNKRYTGKFKQGEKVECNWKGRGKYYSGYILRIRNNKLYIKYNDGDSEKVNDSSCRLKKKKINKTGHTKIKKSKFKSGDLVECKRSGRYTRGKVSNIMQNKMYVDFDGIGMESAYGKNCRFAKKKKFNHNNGNTATGKSRFKIGDKLECQWGSKGRFYAASVLKVTRKKLYIKYYNNYKENINDQLCRFLKKKTNRIKPINLNRNKRNDRKENFRKPSGYQSWNSPRGKVMRSKISSFPLKVYSNHKKYRAPSNYDQMIKRSLYSWNAVGRSLGLKKNIFILASSKSRSNVFIDWSGNGLPSRALGIARLLIYSKFAKITGVVMRQPKSRRFGETTEVVMQELGHLLGLGHSQGRASRDDIMTPTAHTHGHPNLSTVKMTTRDRQMLGYLFNLRDYLPIVPNTSRSMAAVAASGYYGEAGDNDHGHIINAWNKKVRSNVLVKISKGGSYTVGLEIKSKRKGWFGFEVGRRVIIFVKHRRFWRVAITAKRKWKGKHHDRRIRFRTYHKSKLNLDLTKINNFEIRHRGRDIEIYINNSKKVFKIRNVTRNNLKIYAIAKGMNLSFNN